MSGWWRNLPVPDEVLERARTAPPPDPAQLERALQAVAEQRAAEFTRQCVWQVGLGPRCPYLPLRRGLCGYHLTQLPE